MNGFFMDMDHYERDDKFVEMNARLFDGDVSVDDWIRMALEVIDSNPALTGI
jgi:hypothetical protein